MLVKSRIALALLPTIVGCFGFAVSVSAQSGNNSQPQISYTTLPNGVRVIFEPRHTVPIAAVDVWMQAGTRMEKPGEEGAAHYLEHLIFTGTPTHPNNGDIDGAIEDLGGSLDAATSYDWAHFYTVVPSESLKSAVAVVGDAVQHASLTADQVESERPIISDEIQRTSDDASAYASQQVRRQIFSAATAYGRPVTASTDQVQNLDRDVITSFYRRCYVPKSCVVVIVGDTTNEQAVAAVASAFGSWTGANPPDQPKPLAGVQLESSREITNREVSDAIIVMGWHAPSVSDKPDTWVMDVLLTYLGQGGINLLDSDIHLKRKLVKSINADYLTQRDPGLMTITASVDPELVASADSAILKNIDFVVNTALTPEQLASAKMQLIASYSFDTETVSGTADSLGFYEMIDSYQYDADYITHVNSVTANQVQDVARKYLSATNYVETVISPEPSSENATISFHSRSTKRLRDPSLFLLQAKSTQHRPKQTRVD